MFQVESVKLRNRNSKFLKVCWWFPFWSYSIVYEYWNSIKDKLYFAFYLLNKSLALHTQSCRTLSLIFDIKRNDNSIKEWGTIMFMVCFRYFIVSVSYRVYVKLYAAKGSLKVNDFYAISPDLWVFYNI